MDKNNYIIISAGLFVIGLIILIAEYSGQTNPSPEQDQEQQQKPQQQQQKPQQKPQQQQQKPQPQPHQQQQKPQSSTLDANLKKVLDLQNCYRTNGNLQPLSWDTNLQKRATEWANFLQSQGCIMRHPQSSSECMQYMNGSSSAWGGACNDSKGDGQNIALRHLEGSYDPSLLNEPSFSVTGWFNECGDYKDNGIDGNGQETGHYTQLMWPSTTSVGCAISKCPDSGKVLVVCNYAPGGNIKTNPDNQSAYDLVPRSSCNCNIKC